jgi:CheY-like chemotaxis protein
MVTDLLRVMVVDDDELMLELYRCQFELWRLPVALTCMSSTMQALQAIERLAPDLLVTDLSMPGVDGLQFLRELEGSAQLAGMQIVVVSGLQPDRIAAQGGISPNIDVLRKPLDFGWLRRRVAALAQARQTVRP